MSGILSFTASKGFKSRIYIAFMFDLTAHPPNAVSGIAIITFMASKAMFVLHLLLSYSNFSYLLNYKALCAQQIAIKDENNRSKNAPLTGAIVYISMSTWCLLTSQHLRANQQPAFSQVTNFMNK